MYGIIPRIAYKGHAGKVSSYSLKNILLDESFNVQLIITIYYAMLSFFILTFANIVIFTKQILHVILHNTAYVVHDSES